MPDTLQKIEENKNFSTEYVNLGADAYAQNDYRNALIYWKEALESLDALYNDISKNVGERGQLLESIKTVIDDINDKIVHVLNKLADEQCDNHQYIPALVLYEEALKIKPHDANLYNNIGYMYKKVGDKYQNLEKQIEYYEKAIELDPEHKLATRNLALTYPLVGRIDEAIECFHKLFTMEPISDDYVAYGQLKIQSGDFEEGWKHYENRLNLEFPSDYLDIDAPKWDGKIIKDKTLLVHYEQGFGDSFQFFRYLELVKPFAKKIIFRAQDCLADLLKINVNGIEVVSMATPIEELSFDCWVPLLSLVHLLEGRIDNIPSTEGYIKADENKIKTYRQEFFDNECLKIGISWSGAKFGNSYRNPPLECFYPLTKLKNVKICSFQKDFGYEQLQELPPEIEIIDLGKTFEDFSDTAAAISNLDLFVTSDNGVFNLAASMGTKTYLLLNKHSEWRWFFDDETTPWYDSVKIFKKQNESDSWDSLIERVVGVISK